MLTIGEFARLAGVSARMLRHYDALGLLVPTHVDPFTGYRRYDPALLPSAHQLVALKELGFSLDQVGELLRGTTPDQIRTLLEQRRAELAGQIALDSARLAEVERRLRLIEGGSEMEFVEKELPALTVLSRTEVVEDTSQIGTVIGPMFTELAEQLAEAGDPPSHPGVAWYEPEGERLRVSAGYLDKTSVPAGSAFRKLAAQPRAVTSVYVGAMAGIGPAWQELADHVRRAGLEFSGPCRELYLDVEGPEETWVTELQQPVA